MAEHYENIQEKIIESAHKAIICRVIYNWFWNFAKGRHSEKHTLIRKFLIQSEHSYVIREHNFRNWK